MLVHAAGVIVPEPVQKQFVSFGCSSTRELVKPAEVHMSLHESAALLPLAASSELHATSAASERQANAKTERREVVMTGEVRTQSHRPSISQNATKAPRSHDRSAFARERARRTAP